MLQAIGQDLVHHQEDVQDILCQVENLDNQQCRNNIRLKNLKEQTEGPNLHNYIIDLFESILGEEDSNQLNIDSVYRVGQFRQNTKKPRDVIMRFTD